MLTEAQVGKIRSAIDAANRPGVCRYLFEGQPSCVIGCLGAQDGVPTWAIADHWEGNGTVGVLRDTRGILPDYPIKLLMSLQSKWDGARGYSEPEARLQLHELLNAWQVEGGADAHS